MRRDVCHGYSVFARTGQSFRLQSNLLPSGCPPTFALSSVGVEGPFQVGIAWPTVFSLSSRDPRSITLGVRGGINIMKTKDSGRSRKIWLDPLPRRRPVETVDGRTNRDVRGWFEERREDPKHVAWRDVINSRPTPTISLSSVPRDNVPP